MRDKQEDILHTGKKLYSQENEELIIRSFFRDRKHGFFLDIGCAAPDVFSTTYYLEKHLKWSGIAVDANLSDWDGWKRLRPNTQVFKFIVTDHFDTVETFYNAGWLGSTQKVRTINNTVIEGTASRVPTMTLTKLLDDQRIEKIDFLSMDIEESESQALMGFDIARFQPELVCIEQQPVLSAKEAVFAYFQNHDYELIEEYLSYDNINWYFRPKCEPASFLQAGTTFEIEV